jgi:hypothetical protein
MSIVERAARIVSLKEYGNAGNPIEVSSIPTVDCPLPEQYILRMAVRADGVALGIPEELHWIFPLYHEALMHQICVIGVDHPFCYITVRHGEVRSRTDDEWHVDGFSTKIEHVPEQNYIWSDCHPTEYADNLKVSFPEDFNPSEYNVNTYLQHFIWNVSVCNPKTLYCIDPYILHRRPKVAYGAMRTFARISFVPIEINDINNTPNPLSPRQYTKDGVSFRNKLKHYKL